MRRRPSPATVLSALALFVSLSGTAVASIVITKNDQVGPHTIAGANAPTGDTQNLIRGSVGSRDLHKGAVTAQKISVDPWEEVGQAYQQPFTNTCLSSTPPCYSYADYGSGLATVAFYRDPLGVVHLKGLATCTPNGAGTCDPAQHTAIFELPAGDCPQYLETFGDESFAVASNGGYGQVDVLGCGRGSDAGKVVVVAGDPTAWISLDGITFRAGG